MGQRGNFGSNLPGFASCRRPEENLDCSIFELGFWVQEPVQNDPEVRGVILTKFGPKRSHLDPVQVHFYSFRGPDLCTCLPMSAWGSEKKL